MVPGRRSILSGLFADERRGSARAARAWGVRHGGSVQRRTRSPRAAAGVIRESAQPLSGGAKDYGSLLELIGDARFVLLGEASHGTHEFYFERAKITKRLSA